MRLISEFTRRLHNPGISLGPVITAARDQPHPIPVTLKADAEAVVLDFVKPLRACRDLGCVGRQAELERLEHAAQIGIRSRLCDRRLTAGTTPFSPPSARRKRLTLPHGAVG